MNGRTQITITLLLFFFGVASDGRDLEPKVHGVYQFTQLFDALNNNAGIYICTVSRRESSESDVFERGKVTLSVSRTLFGPDRKNLTLPYCFVLSKVTGYKNESELVWPRLNLIDKKNLLCVVIPGAVDPACPVIEGADGAASRVTVLADSSDSKVAEMEAIIQLHLAIQTEAASESIKAALKDKRPEMRRFALLAIVFQFGKVDPDGAIGILRSHADAWKDSRDDRSEGVGLVLNITDKFGVAEPQTQKFAARCLATLATTHCSEVRQDAIRVLGYGVGVFAISSKVGLLDDLPAMEKAALIEVVKADTDADPNAQKVKSALLP